MRTWLPLADSVGPTSGTPTSAPAAAPTPAPTATPAPAEGGAAAPATQGTTSAPGSANTQPAKPAPGLQEMLMQALPFILIVVVFYFLLFRGRGKEDRERRKQLETLKRGDEVQMIGGLIGKVVEVRGDRVIIKVDEANNVKETYLKSAIHRVIEPDDKDKNEDAK